MSSSTANYGFIKPDVGDDNWGPVVNSDLDAIDAAIADAASGGGGDGLPAATAFTTTTMPNPITSGDMTVIVLSEDNPVLAVAQDGDSFPRWLLTSDGGDGLYIGDGSFDPYSSGVSIWAAPAGPGVVVLSISSPGGVINVDSDIGYAASKGPILRSPDTTRYRITVNNDGSLSTTVVP